MGWEEGVLGSAWDNKPGPFDLLSQILMGQSRRRKTPSRGSNKCSFKTVRQIRHWYVKACNPDATLTVHNELQCVCYAVSAQSHAHFLESYAHWSSQSSTAMIACHVCLPHCFEGTQLCQWKPQQSYEIQMPLCSLSDDLSSMYPMNVVSVHSNVQLEPLQKKFLSQGQPNGMGLDDFSVGKLF